MRLASFRYDFWQIRSAEESHHQEPGKFWIPALEKRQSLHRGQAAKLIFDIEVEQEDGRLSIQGERMWVIVSEKIGDIYLGILDSQPTCLESSNNDYLRFGAEVAFQAEHVIEIAQPPAEYIEWQLGQSAECIWPRDE